MAQTALRIEGQWEQVLTLGESLRGRRVTVTALGEEPEYRMGDLARADVATKLALLDAIEELTKGMNPPPDPVDHLREGRAGPMYGYEPGD